MIAMPLLALFIDVGTATPLVAFMGFSISLMILLRHWKAAYIEGLWRLILFCLLGIPLGLYFLKYADERIIKLCLAIVIILFSMLNLLKINKFALKNEKAAWIFGLISGALGGAYNTNGPPVIIYGRLRNWEAQNFRAILQTVFLPTNLFIIIGQGAAGFWTANVLKLFVISLPSLILGTLAGALINRKTKSGQFKAAVDILLIVIGIVLIANTIFTK